MKKFLLTAFLLLPLLYMLNSCKDEGVTDSNLTLVTFTDNYPWQYSTPAAEGLSDSLVNAGFAAAQATGYINGIVIVRNSKIAAERYYRNTNANTVFDIKSSTKSFVSALIGNAIQRNYITLDTKLVDALPEYKSFVTDTRVNTITVRHLLTMTSGIKNDDDLNLRENLNSDWVKLIITRGLDYEPGTTYRYSDAGVHLLSVILTEKTKQNTRLFANSTLFGYLNMNLDSWLPDPQGIPFGGANMYMTLKAMATLGVLYMNKGIYNNRPVVPENWINSSLTDYIGGRLQNRGKMIKVGYGYLWWLGEIAGHKVFAIMGYAGQLVVCIPDLNMAVATSAPSDVYDEQAIIQNNKLIELISDYFIPAAK
jgi:CubicO group peptidase (beta-lactamase class C family)